jgi:hypothetical protein
MEKERIRMTKESAEKLTPKEYQARFNAAGAQAQREYCNIFKFWRACRYKPCRRAGACRGDQRACLKRGVANVPRDILDRAHNQVIAATPADAIQPERTARRFCPISWR